MVSTAFSPLSNLKNFPTSKCNCPRWCRESPYRDYNGIIADGSIRAGKTLAMAISAVIWAMSTFQVMNFAMCGKTVSAFAGTVWAWLKPDFGYSGLRHRGTPNPKPDYHIQREEGKLLLCVRRSRRVFARLDPRYYAGRTVL